MLHRVFEGVFDTVTGHYRRLAIGLFLAGAIITMGAGSSSVAAETQPSFDLDKEIDGWASEIGAPGMTAQILDADGVLSEASTGVDGWGEPVDTSTPFVWGSVSKQFTAATVSGLERDGIIDAASLVVDVVPQARRMLADPATTIDDLVHHTSGLPHDLEVTDDWTRRESATEAVASIAEPDEISQRGTFRYSSLNYLLLQAVVEQATEGSYASALDQEVLEPADATATITDPDEYIRDIAPGHVPFFGSAKQIDVGVDSSGLGYGYLAGSIEELGHYASWRLTQLRDGEDSAPEMDTGHGTKYGGGLFHENIGGQEVWWHSGAVPGYYTYVALIPGENKAVVLATNKYGELEAERIAAVGRNLTTLTIDGSTSELPGSLASIVLGVLLSIVAILVAVIAWVTMRLFTGRTRERSLLGAGVRILTTTILGGVVFLGAFFGVPSILGASMPVLWLWAPDVTLVFWILLAAAFMTAAIVVVNEVVNYSRLRHR